MFKKGSMGWPLNRVRGLNLFYPYRGNYTCVDHFLCLVPTAISPTNIIILDGVGERFVFYGK